LFCFTNYHFLVKFATSILLYFVCFTINLILKKLLKVYGNWLLTCFFLTFFYVYGLNMFLVPQVSAKFGISPSSKLLTNLVLLTKFC